MLNALLEQLIIGVTWVGWVGRMAGRGKVIRGPGMGARGNATGWERPY